MSHLTATGDMMEQHAQAYERFVVELARHPGMIDRLLATHPQTGGCSGCRLPGAQVAITAPCSIRTLAERAREAALIDSRAS